eukprot:TRINITY_DN28798_c0_g2_i1.p1 TRINITY_DN28798_c0_g2~~TRINITY_DN28798_c0_g2_i1.p1  ORF type:complete len:991 (+),score=327.43 TRINITY_DN28798_c0_g2_i1:191-3163(+)
MEGMQRDLLQSQLKDLESWCTQQRTRDHFGHSSSGGGGYNGGYPQDQFVVLDDEDDDDGADPASAGVHHLLHAQLREVDAWLKEVRRRSSEDDSRAQLQAATLRPRSDDDVPRSLLELGKERRWAIGKYAQSHVSADLGAAKAVLEQQRVDAAHTALRKLKEAETQRELALGKARGLQLQSAEDFGRLSAQLQALENEPFKARQLGAYATTDVALAFVGAIEHRLQLVKVLSEALRAKGGARTAVDAYEQLLTCSAALDALPAASHLAGGGGGLARQDFVVAPAARLVDDVLDGGGVPDLDRGPQLRRLQQLADKNRELWSDLAKLAEVVSVEPENSTGALQHELTALRQAEGKLDSLLGGTAAGGADGVPGSPTGGSRSLGQMWSSTAMAVKVAGARLDATEGRVANLLKSKSDGFKMTERHGAGRQESAGGKGSSPLVIFSSFMQVSLLDMLWGWRATAADLRDFKRKQRRAARKRMLLKRGPKSWAFWFFVCNMTRRTQVPLPQRPRDRQRLDKPMVRDKEGYQGILMSSTSEGMCKVMYGFPPHSEVLFQHASSLVWLRDDAHPLIAYVLFAGWAHYCAQLEDIMLTKCKVKLQNMKGQQAGQKLLTYLTLDKNDYMSVGRFFLRSWQMVVRKRSDESLKALKEYWKAWRHGVAQGRHAKAVRELQKTNAELHHARTVAMRQRTRAEKLKKKLAAINDAEDVLWTTAVFTAWLSLKQLSAQAKILKESFEQMEKAAYAKGITAAFRASGFMGKKSVKKLVQSALQAWARSLKDKKRKGIVMRNIEQNFVGATLSAAFTAWAQVKQVDEKASAEGLRAAVELSKKETEQLHEVSRELYNFAKDADTRVQQMEEALRAADVAMQMGVRQNAAMEREVQYVRTQMSAMKELLDRAERAEQAAAENKERHSEAAAGGDKYYQAYEQQEELLDQLHEEAWDYKEECLFEMEMRDEMKDALMERDAEMDALKSELAAGLDRASVELRPATSR